MLSICIPTYNYDATKLVTEINEQSDHTGLAYEIIVLDDCSDNQATIRSNQKLNQYEKVRYTLLSSNMGRSVVRNYLAKQAKYPNLLFLDCDTYPKHPSFIKAYSEQINNADVIIGGICYHSRQPSKTKTLRWKYGRKTETTSASDRSQAPYSSFMTGNFMIKKSIFDEIVFDETISKYGHEDTFFGICLKKKAKKILHIDNPVYHEGIENNETFIRKSAEGIENLIALQKSHPDLKNELEAHIRLISTANKLTNLRLKSFFLLLYKLMENPINKNLKSAHPNLKLFNVYKLGHYLSH